MLTSSQDVGLRLIKQWIHDRPLRKSASVWREGGPAGSGKSYLIPLIADIVSVEKCMVMTPTGKVANNLLKAGLVAQTIHSAIYHVKDNTTDEPIEEDTEEANKKPKPKKYAVGDPEFVLKDQDTYKNIELFIIDEGSMVGGKLLADLLSFGVDVLLIGDPNQLAPVNDASVFVRCDHYLTEIVRQAQDNPIIWLSQQILNGNLPLGQAGSCIVRNGDIIDNELLFADTVLVDTNNDRNELNAHIRELRIPESRNPNANWILEGDQIICRTNCVEIGSSKGFMLTNGTLGIVSEILHISQFEAEFTMDAGDLGEYTLIGTCFPTYFPPSVRPPTVELGYALTVHLSQGSEWPNVMYKKGPRATKRAIYTAVTRAKESLLVIV